MKIYFAGPLFTMGERIWNKHVSNQLIADGHSVFLPQEEEQTASEAAIYASDVAGLDWAAVIVAILDGADADSGTCWECGYAIGQGKPVVTVRTDFRRLSDDNPVNLMMSEGARANLWITKPDATPFDVAKAIHAVLEDLNA